ncbi:MAG: efflux RND transporter periplasmic adaptor subunit [Deltaproteobacteria bacterium]|nr:efflux RND transporter periplasmic adaptor subunit [Deltaproteobacteria bacterium]
MIRRVPLLILLVACGSASGQEETSSAPTERAPADPPSATATRVEVATTSTTRASVSFQLPGEIEGSRDALLAAALGGYIERVMVDEGETVTRNQVLARVDTASHGARAAQARVELEAAERELERAERLTGAISQQQLHAAENRVAAARAALQAARVTASRGTIRAPFAGTIAQVGVEQGEVAAPGAPMVRLVQLDPVHVSLAVPDRDVVALRRGMTVSVTTGATPTPVEGVITHVSPAADLQTRAFEVTVEVPNENGRLLPGMIAQVQIVGGEDTAPERVVLPQYVLVTRLDGNGVFVEEDGVARWRSIEVGSVMRDQVVVLGGLEAGERVIVTGHRELADGDEVMVTREGECCTGGRVTFGGTGPAVTETQAADTDGASEEEG